MDIFLTPFNALSLILNLLTLLPAYQVRKELNSRRGGVESWGMEEVMYGSLFVSVVARFWY